MQSYSREHFRQMVNTAHASSGCSLREIEAMTGISSSFVCQILNGKRHPTRDTLILLCGYGWILTFEETNAVLATGGHRPLSQRKKVFRDHTLNTAQPA